MNNNRAVTSKILTLNDLIQEENFNSWQDFVKVLMASPENYNNFYWRGHANANWSIIPSYTRNCEDDVEKITNSSVAEYDKTQLTEKAKRRFDLHFEITDDYENLLFYTPKKQEEIFYVKPQAQQLEWEIIEESKQYSDYAKNLSRIYESNKTAFCANGVPLDYSFLIEMDLSQWAWGQHYEVGTPLVDWTLRPLIALYFACSSSSEMEIAVYSLNYKMVQMLNRNTIRKEDNSKYITFFKDMAFSACLIANSEFDDSLKEICNDCRKLKILRQQNHNSEISRLNAQAGLFTFTPNGISIEEWCRLTIDFFSGHPILWRADGKDYVIKKHIIKIDENERKKCLSFLDAANINAQTIYPDFQGIKRYMTELRERRTIR